MISKLKKRGTVFTFNQKGNEIWFTDKYGDVYSVALKDDAQPILQLGHISLLMDILITPSEDYVITCDRDEKIRVSHYPNAYVIHNFCWGHKEWEL